MSCQPTNYVSKEACLLRLACACLLAYKTVLGYHCTTGAPAAVLAAAALRHWPRRTRPSTTNVVVFPVPHAPFPSGARWCGGGIDGGGSASSPAPACACLLTCLTACSHPRPPSGHWATLLANYYTRALRHRCRRRSLHGCFYFLCVLCTPLYCCWMAAINRENAAHTGPLYPAVEVGFSVHLIGRLDVSISDRSRLLRVSPSSAS